MWKKRLLEQTSDLVWHLRLVRKRLAEEVVDLNRRARAHEPRRYLGAATRVVAISVVATGLTVLAMGAGLTIYPHVADSRWSELELLDSCAQAITVSDRKGWVGNIPASMLVPYRVPCQQVDLESWHSHVAGYVADPPDAWWEMMLAVEDRRHGTLASINCVDLPALIVVVFNAVQGRWSRGGSTVTMQLSRSLRGTAPRNDETVRQKVRRKLTEIADATVLCRALGPDLKRWVARHLPCMHGTAGSEIGGSIYGLEDCSRIAFAKPVGELDIAEQAVLVASVYRHILLAPAGDRVGQQRAADRWERIRQRAAYAIYLVYGSDDPIARSARSRLSKMKPPVPVMGPALQDLLADSRSSVASAGNPEMRVTRLARGEVNQALGEILDLYGEIPGDLIGIELSLDVADNAAFKRDLEAMFDGRSEYWPVRLDLPPPRRAGARMADVTLSLVMDGHVQRHYTAGYDRLWAGANAKRDESGRYRPEREDRAIGSVAKILAAPLLGAHFTSTDALCNQWLDGLRNAGGGRGFRNCASSTARVQARTAFARSQNLPIAWALRPVTEIDIRTIIDDAGFQLPDPAVAPRVALAFGLVTAGVRDQHRLVAAMHRGIRGRVPQAVLPTMVRRLYFRNEDGGLRSVDFDEVRDRARIDLTAWFEHSNVGAFVAQVLGAPARPGGTLAGLDQVIRSTGGGQLIAKSGTTTTPDDRIRDQVIVGAALGHGGKDMSFQLLVGSPHPGQPLADRAAVPRVDRLQMIERLLRGVPP